MEYAARIISHLPHEENNLPTFQIFSRGALRIQGSALVFMDSKMASLMTSFNFVEFFNK